MANRHEWRYDVPRDAEMWSFECIRLEVQALLREFLNVDP